MLMLRLLTATKILQVDTSV